MPNTKSAKKRLTQSKNRRAINRARKSAMKSQIKKVRAAVDAGDFDQADAAYKLAAKSLDKAGAKRTIHPNTAGRTKSRLQQMIKQAKSA